MTLGELGALWMNNAWIWTENGLSKIQDHLESMHTEPPTFVYRCIGCGGICCQCFGGAPDPRCDNCVAGDL